MQLYVLPDQLDFLNVHVHVCIVVHVFVKIYLDCHILNGSERYLYVHEQFVYHKQIRTDFFHASLCSVRFHILSHLSTSV